MSAKTNPTTTTLYFDGACHLCSREIDHYRRQPGATGLAFVDIADPHFVAADHGLDPKAVRTHMHVRRPNGALAVGLDAFVAIWQVLPRYGWLARWAQRQPLRAAMRAGYSVFARLRPLLPKRVRNTCDDDACALHPRGDGG